MKEGSVNRGLRAKRLFDIAITVLALPIWGPLLALIAASLYLGQGSPVLFRQRRPGYLGKPFQILKFRTMSDARDADGRLLPDEERITPGGAFLRSTSLDELPELINVLRGEMSLVGPRPLLMEYLEQYTPEQARRHEVPPGLTGWAQVNGRNDTTWEERFDLDTWYVDNHTLMLDLRILLKTVSKVLSAEGISAEGHATMPKLGEDL